MIFIRRVIPNAIENIEWSNIKLTKIICIILILIPSLSYPQNQERDYSHGLSRNQSLFPLQSTGIWTEMHPLIPRVIYFGVHFTNADTGWAVGEGGAIIKTINGGQKWNWIESGVENTLKTIFSVNNGQRVIVAGDGGVILISENGGESWSTMLSPTTNNIWNMQMITDNIGWMVGESATALKTTDAGLTWIQQPMPHTTLPYWDVSFIDTNYGYIACNSAIILKTTNGGIDWQIQTAGDYRGLYTVYSFDSLKVIAGGGFGKIVITTDGGSNWTQMPDLQGNGNINRIKFFNSLNGFLVTTAGNFQTTDGGYTWINRNDLHNSTVTWNIDFPDLQSGYIVGSEMFLVKSTDTGLSWSQTIIRDDFLNVYFKDSQNGFINSNEKIYKTTDGGTSLTILESFPYNDSYSTRAMTFIDNSTGFVGSGTYLQIYKTTNGGMNWYGTSINDSVGTISEIFFLNSTIGFAVSLNGKIFKTIDGGENWNLKFSSPPNTFFSGINFSSDSIAWVVGTNTFPFEIYKSTNAGENWNSVIVDFMDMNDVYFYNDQIGFITGTNKLYKTTDAGITWLQDVQISASILKFKAIGNTHFFITGNIHESIDTGDTWNNITPEIGTTFSNLYSPQDNFCVPIGSMGLVINYIDTATVPVELTNFTGQVNGLKVFLSWVTITEKNNYGFEIQRSENKTDWEVIGFVQGRGTTTEIQNYSFEDNRIAKQSYFYRLVQQDYNGTYKYSDIVEVKISLNNFELFQNYPNPANPSTIIKYIVPIESFIELTLFDIKGEKISNLFKGKQQPGLYSTEVNMKNLASGVYFYTLKSSTGYNQTKKLLIFK